MLFDEKVDLMRLHFSIPRLALSLILVATICAAAHAQTDLALSGYGTFGTTTNTSRIGNTIFTEIPSNSAGGMIELRHISNPLVGYEATYGFNRANQTYNSSSFACPVGVLPPCAAPASASVSADAHEISGDWIASVH